MAKPANRLPYSPPGMTSFLTLHVGGDYNFVDGSVPNNLRYKQDYINHGLLLPQSTVHDFGGGDVLIIGDSPVNAGHYFTNYRALVGIGLKSDISKPWVDPNSWTSDTTPPYGNSVAGSAGYVNAPRNNFQLVNQNVTNAIAFLEGCDIGGTYAIDGLKMSLGRTHTLYTQLCRFLHWNAHAPGSSQMVGYTPGAYGGSGRVLGTGSSGGTDPLFHNDNCQSYGGLGRWFADWCTFIGGFQCIMFRIGATGGTGYWLDTKLSRCNFASAQQRGLGTDQKNGSTGKSNLLNHIYATIEGANATNQHLEGPIDLDNVFFEYNASQFASLADMFGATGAGSTYGPQSLTDPETGRPAIRWNNFPKYAGYQTTSEKLYTARSLYINGLPLPTTSHPENPTAIDFALAADIGVGYISPGYANDTPPVDPTPPGTTNPLPIPKPNAQGTREIIVISRWRNP